MNHPIDENAQLDVEISNLRASDEELAVLKKLLERGLEAKATAPIIRSVGSDAKGKRYEVTFKVLEPRHFSMDAVKDWLHSATLVGWRIEATVVPRK